MAPFFTIFYLLYFTFCPPYIEGQNEKTQPCQGHQASFDLQKVLGPWHVVAIVPDNGFPRLNRISCYKMEVSETDEAGLRWLISKKVENPSQEMVQRIRGTIIRQRYHSEKPFDIWSRAIPGINGCFRQLFSLGTNKTNISDAENLVTFMQLHLMETNDRGGPFLVQLLWGKLISAVIYRREEGVSRERLLPVRSLVTYVKGYHMPMLICTKLEKELEPPAFQRP